MAGRILHPSTSAALGADVVYEAWIYRLDILNDPIEIWTGPRNVQFTNSGDAALDNVTFEGLGDIGEIGNVVDGRGGSQAVSLTLPGINLDDDALRQVVFNKSTWQRRPAWIWIATLDADYNIIGVPFRIKTGRMDNMTVGQGRSGNFVEVIIESHQSYASEELNTKYSEQKDIDATDISQAYVHDLANRTAVIGGTVANNSTLNASQALLAQLGKNSPNSLISQLR